MHPGTTLTDAIRLWPTPAASVVNDGEDLEGWEARRQRNLLTGQNGNGQGTPLTVAAAQWATPSARDWKDSPGMSFEGINPDGSKRERVDQLARQVNRWSTPSAHDGRRPGSDSTSTQDRNLKREGEAWSEHSRPAPTTGPDGLPPLLSTPRLNPRFVEWLMGLPLGWTDSECSATQLFRWWRLMRSELLRLGC